MPLPPAPPLVLDPAAFAHLDSATSYGDWRSTLEMLGVWDLGGLDGAVGADLRELREAVTEGERSSANTPHVSRRVVDSGAVQQAISHGGLALLVAGAVIALLRRELPYLGAGVGCALLGLGLAWLVGRLPWPGRAPPAPAGWPRDRALRALKRLLSRTFVAAAGLRIVESTLHHAWLQLRLRTIDRAIRAANGRIAGFTTLREHLLETNVRLGRPGEDTESNKLKAAIAVQDATLRNLATLRALVQRRLAELDAQVAALRAVAERRVLSARVRRLTDEAAAPDPADGLAAEVRVDVAEIEGRIRALGLDTGDADTRLRAVLEAVGVRA